MGLLLTKLISLTFTLNVMLGNQWSALGVAVVTNSTFQEKSGGLFCWPACAVNLQPCSRPPGPMAHAASPSVTAKLFWGDFGRGWSPCCLFSSPTPHVENNLWGSNPLMHTKRGQGSLIPLHTTESSSNVTMINAGIREAVQFTFKTKEVCFHVYT